MMVMTKQPKQGKSKRKLKLWRTLWFWRFYGGQAEETNCKLA
jgi:hypothetical protein